MSHGDIGGGQATDALQVKIGGGLVEGQHCWGRTQTFEKLNHPYHSTFTNTQIQILQIQIKKKTQTDLKNTQTDLTNV